MLKKACIFNAFLQSNTNSAHQLKNYFLSFSLTYNIQHYTYGI